MSEATLALAIAMAIWLNAGAFRNWAIASREQSFKALGYALVGWTAGAFLIVGALKMLGITPR